MKFWKMNGAGNDFIIINNIEEKLPIEKFGSMGKILCERHLSIGADGFMVVEKPTNPTADIKMLFFNSDGSMGEMCGNGARCICRYAYENGLCKDKEKQVVESTAGIVTGIRIDNENYKIRLNDPCNISLDIDIDGYKVSYVELGNPGIPHAVVEIKNLQNYDRQKLFELGRKLRYDKHFAKGANVNFYEIIGDNHLYEITYERGVEDFTYACGTGTGSVATILNMKNLVSDKNIKVDVRGGTLIIDIDKLDGKIKDLYLTGPTNVVAKGEIYDNNLL